MLLVGSNKDEANFVSLYPAGLLAMLIVATLLPAVPVSAQSLDPASPDAADLVLFTVSVMP